MGWGDDDNDVCLPCVRSPVVIFNPQTVMMSRACERELCSFRLVQAVARFIRPNSKTCEHTSNRILWGVWVKGGGGENVSVPQGAGEGGHDRKRLRNIDLTSPNTV